VAAHYAKVSDEARASAEDAVLNEEVFRTEYISGLKAEILRGLSFVHDYKQINAEISQNINVVLETRYQGATLEEKLSSATREEKAIYAASKFLEEKLNVAKFLVQPEWLLMASECRRFRVHGLVLKYIRIYQSHFDSRRVALTLEGESYKEILANPTACGVIPHTLIDNALKYAPAHSSVEVFVQDEDDGVYLEVCSFGPRLEKKEHKKIFHPFYRGREASRLVEEGAGYGLYVSQLVAKQHLGTAIAVVQEEKPNDHGREYVWTTFSMTFPPQASVCP
jgi:signal transduction histidine kinase